MAVSTRYTAASCTWPGCPTGGRGAETREGLAPAKHLSDMSTTDAFQLQCCESIKALQTIGPGFTFRGHARRLSGEGRQKAQASFSPRNQVQELAGPRPSQGPLGVLFEEQLGDAGTGVDAKDVLGAQGADTLQTLRQKLLQQQARSASSLVSQGKLSSIC